MPATTDVHCHARAAPLSTKQGENKEMRPSASSDWADEPAARPKKCPAASRPGREVLPLIPGRLSFAAHASVEVTHEEIARYPKRFYFSSDCQELYDAFCLDFGPVNLAVVHKFCRFMGRFWRHGDLSGRELVYYTADTLEDRTNTAFLLAAFMVADLGYSPEAAWAPFAKLPKDSLATFRDATFCEQTYGLTVLACLQGLKKALSLGWYDPKAFSSEAYVVLQSCEAGDMHQVSPKFIAFKGPVDPHAELTDDVGDEDSLPPEHYAKLFHCMGVSCVVRLNEASTYDSKAFTKRGIRHHDIYFDDCTMPSLAVVEAFLKAADDEGVVAVHCRAGLGRTGTLIAVHMMEHDGLTAAEAIGWLRIVRPGSVIGDQQHFLHWYEATRGGTVECSLQKTAMFNLLTNQRSGPCGCPRELGRMVKRAQVDRAKRAEAASEPPAPPFDDCPPPLTASAVAPAPPKRGADKGRGMATGEILRSYAKRKAIRSAPAEPLLDCSC